MRLDCAAEVFSEDRTETAFDMLAQSAADLDAFARDRQLHRATTLLPGAWRAPSPKLGMLAAGSSGAAFPIDTITSPTASRAGAEPRTECASPRGIWRPCAGRYRPLPAAAGRRSARRTACFWQPRP